MKKHCLKLVFMLAFSVCANAQVSDRYNKDVIDGVIDYAIPPELIADSIVIYVPDRDMPLHRSETTERIIEGKIIQVKKGVEPNLIVHNAHTIIRPLEAGVPMRLFLKRFPDRDAYYPIAIFSTTSGVKQ